MPDPFILPASGDIPGWGFHNAGEVALVDPATRKIVGFASDEPEPVSAPSASEAVDTPVAVPAQEAEAAPEAAPVPETGTGG